MSYNRRPRKVRTESDVMKLHYASLSRARKANQMEDRRHAMRVEDELTSTINYELATMERERKQIQRELAALKLQSNKDALRRHQAAVVRHEMRQQELRDSLVPSPLPMVESSPEERRMDHLIASGFLVRKEKKSSSQKTKSAKAKSKPRREVDEGNVDVAMATTEEEEDVKWELQQVKVEKPDPRPRPRVPSFQERMAEARKARYIRSQDPVVVERERELTTAEIFGTKSSPSRVSSACRQ